MNNNLLDEFISEECSKTICNMLISDINKLKQTDTIKLKEYTFNRFNLYLNFETETALVEDELDVEESGEITISLSCLINKLKIKVDNMY